MFAMVLTTITTIWRPGLTDMTAITIVSGGMFCNEQLNASTI